MAKKYSPHTRRSNPSASSSRVIGASTNRRAKIGFEVEIARNAVFRSANARNAVWAR
jgi:hypothetical protein